MTTNTTFNGRPYPDPAWFPDADKRPEDLVPEGYLSAAEFIYRLHSVRCGNYDYSKWAYDVTGKRSTEATGYPNYYSAWDNAYRNRITGDVVFLYVPPSPNNLTEEIRQEAAITIPQITGRSPEVIRRWLGLDPPDVDAYLRAWLDCPRDEKLHRHYTTAVRRAREFSKDAAG